MIVVFGRFDVPLILFVNISVFLKEKVQKPLIV